MPPLTYANYLDLEKLLTLQKPRSTPAEQDRKSTRLNSSHSQIPYAVFCLKKKKNRDPTFRPTSPLPATRPRSPLPTPSSHTRILSLHAPAAALYRPHLVPTNYTHSPPDAP